MPISTHILDTSIGRPAAGVPVSLSRLEAGQWQDLGQATTNADGRCPHLLPPGPELATSEVPAGLYRIRFETNAYYESLGVEGLYPYVEIAFYVRRDQFHCHIPLLLTAHSYTTYRGS